MEEKRSYDKLYLLDVMHVTEYLFVLFMKSGHDYFKCVDKYMRESDVRLKMDAGNWSALNKGVNQLMESVDISDIPSSDNESMDEGISEWIADVYVFLQWRYCIPSAHVNKVLPAGQLYNLFCPLHETSLENGCEKIKKNYFMGWGDYHMTINSFQGDYYFLSNYYPCKVYYDGIEFGNAEAAFQAQKCANSEQRAEFSKLDAASAKKLGRSVSLRSDWESIKVRVMRDIVEAKFKQNADLMERLMATEGAYLEEGNTWGDRIWGTVNGSGANLLGSILMETREEHRIKALQEAVQKKQRIDMKPEKDITVRTPKL